MEKLSATISQVPGYVSHVSSLTSRLDMWTNELVSTRLSADVLEIVSY